MNVCCLRLFRIRLCMNCLTREIADKFRRERSFSIVHIRTIPTETNFRKINAPPSLCLMSLDVCARHMDYSIDSELFKRSARFLYFCRLVCMILMQFYLLLQYVCIFRVSTSWKNLRKLGILKDFIFGKIRKFLSNFIIFFKLGEFF